MATEDRPRHQSILIMCSTAQTIEIKACGAQN
jgi:hypothetical protein